MNKAVLKGMSLLLAGVLTAGTLAGCGNKSGDANKTSSQSGSSSTTASYPLKTDVKLTYWLPMNTNWTSFAKNYSETPFAQELEKRTGVKVEYIHPALGQEKDVFNILVASGDYPDIIEYKWTTFPGGPSAALGNNIIIKLNNAIEKYSPNLKQFYTERPELSKQSKMDDGSYYFYPLFRDGKELLNTSGPIVRKDWLDELGMQLPETIDDWYTMLKAFKEKKNATAPLSAVGDKNGAQVNYIFEGAFNVKGDFYVDNGKLVFSHLDPQYKDFLAFLAKLYQEGLMDKNFASTDKKTQDSNILNGKSGATYGPGGSSLGVWLTTMKEKDPKFDLAAAKFPTQKKGDKVKVGNAGGILDQNAQAAITTKCKNVEIAARFLDYAYSKEGHMFFNFGVEGQTYTMVNGIPTYSELIMKNPDKLSVAQALSKYTKANMSGPFRQDPQYINQFYELPQQKEALKKWSDHDKLNTAVPAITPTDEESNEYAKIMNDINTYDQEMSIKFIMGSVPLSDFDKYVSQLKKMNIEKAATLRQQAYDRFTKR